MLRTVPAVLLTCLSIAACGGGSEPAAAPTATTGATSPAPSASPSPTAAPLTEADLLALLLAPEDVPQVPIYQPYANPARNPPVTTLPEPYPFLCRSEAARPEASADVTISTEPTSQTLRGPYLMQVVRVFPDADAAREVHAARKQAAQACGDFTASNGLERTVRPLGPVAVPAPAEGFQYESEQRPAVPIPASVETEVLVGRVTITLRSGVQAPPGLEVPAWQAQLAARATEKVLAAAP